MAKDDDTRRKWNQTHHFPTQNNRPILGSYWFYLLKKIHFRRKLHLSGNMKEEMRSAWGHAYMPSLCNILIFSFYRSFLWALIKGNGIKVFFLPLSNVLLTLNTVTQIAGGWDLPTEEELHFPLLPGCDWNTWLVPFGLATCSCSEVAADLKALQGQSGEEGARVLSHTFFHLPSESTSQRSPKMHCFITAVAFFS